MEIYWEILTKLTEDKDKWLCKCRCGFIGLVRKKDLKREKTTKCKKCSKSEMKTWASNNIGLTINYWTVIGKSTQERMVLCKCICGTEKEVSQNHMRRGISKSCGCKKTELTQLTNIIRYSNTCSLHSPEISAKTITTNLERYGSRSPMQSQKIVNKVRSTMMERYGYEHALQITEFKHKMEQTNLERYGDVSAIRNSSIREKAYKTIITNQSQSKGEAELRDWIASSFGITAPKSYCGGANPCEIDIHIPERGVSIEYNGDYWHSEKYTPNNYHLQKTQLVREQKNTQLIHIFESEWKNNPERVKAFLSGKLSKGIPIRASKCEIHKVPLKEMREFCEYHLQGPPHASIINLGLYYNDELLAIATVSKPHRQNMGSEYHLSRFITKPGFRVHGGLSKLSQEIHKRFGKFITYVHLRLSDGKSYEKAGYALIGTSPPDYWYFDSKTGAAVSKQSRMKKKVNTPEGMTESEHAKLDGLYRIWDCGKLKFLYNGK